MRQAGSLIAVRENYGAVGIELGNKKKRKIIRTVMHDTVRLVDSMGKITESSRVILLKHRGHITGLSILNRIHVQNHKRIPPRKILGSMLIFLLWAAVRRKILLSNFGLVFLRILQLPFE
nr:hypothetical protein OVVYNVSZ_OVVYNVSZ_CDS_0006 [Microvirus sp.]